MICSRPSPTNIIEAILVRYHSRKRSTSSYEQRDLSHGVFRPVPNDVWRFGIGPVRTHEGRRSVLGLEYREEGMDARRTNGACLSSTRVVVQTGG